MDEIEALKAELEQTKVKCEMLTQLNQIKTGFLGRIAHELRSPLSTLMGLHQLILSDLCESPAEERDCLNNASQAANTLLKIIDDIVNVSKLEYGMIPLVLETIFLQEIFEDLEQLTYLQANNRNLRLEILPSKLTVIGDRSRLLQILFLLIDGVIGIAESGIIQVLSSQDHLSGIIQIKSQCSMTQWQTPSHHHYSLNLKYLLAEKLMILMGGQIFLKEISSESNYQTLIEMILPTK